MWKSGKEKVLNQFVEEVKRRMSQNRLLSNEAASSAQEELSSFIVEQTQRLVESGFSVNKIQDALQEAMKFEEDHSVTESIPVEVLRTPIELPFYTRQMFTAISKERIEEFTCGKIEIINVFENACLYLPSKVIEIIEILFDLLKERDLNLLGGEILADRNGNGFVLEEIEFSYEGTVTNVISEPVVYKEMNEVSSIFNEIMRMIELLNDKEELLAEELQGQSEKLLGHFTLEEMNDEIQDALEQLQLFLNYVKESEMCLAEFELYEVPDSEEILDDLQLDEEFLYPKSVIESLRVKTSDEIELTLCSYQYYSDKNQKRYN